jgi:hypothetical protein
MKLPVAFMYLLEVLTSLLIMPFSRFTQSHGGNKMPGVNLSFPLQLR